MGDLLCNITIQCTFRFVFCRSEILCLKLSFLFVFITLSYFHYKIFCRYIIINTECFHNSHRNMCFLPIRHQTMECYQSQQLVLFFSFDTQTTKYTYDILIITLSDRLYTVIIHGILVKCQLYLFSYLVQYNDKMSWL